MIHAVALHHIHGRASENDRSFDLQHTWTACRLQLGIVAAEKRALRIRDNSSLTGLFGVSEFLTNEASSAILGFTIIGVDSNGIS